MILTIVMISNRLHHSHSVLSLLVLCNIPAIEDEKEIDWNADLPAGNVRHGFWPKFGCDLGAAAAR